MDQHVNKTLNFNDFGVFTRCSISKKCYMSNIMLTFSISRSEVGGEHRRCPDRESKPSTQHQHRTHDTTDQWREIFGGWAEIMVLGYCSPGLPKSVPSKKIM